jgi:hypothetical protein
VTQVTHLALNNVRMEQTRTRCFTRKVVNISEVMPSPALHKIHKSPLKIEHVFLAFFGTFALTQVEPNHCMYGDAGGSTVYSHTDDFL